jgi:hypothetical protein
MAVSSKRAKMLYYYQAWNKASTVIQDGGTTGERNKHLYYFHKSPMFAAQI